jgi:hypothetical protein
MLFEVVMFVIGIGFAAASLCVLLWELRHAPEATEDGDGLTIVQPTDHASARSAGKARSLLAHRSQLKGV